MTVSLHFILFAAAFVAFALATFNVPARIQLVALGLALWVATNLV